MVTIPAGSVRFFICEPQSQERVKASIKALGEVSARVI